MIKYSAIQATVTEPAIGKTSFKALNFSRQVNDSTLEAWQYSSIFFRFWLTALWWMLNLALKFLVSNVCLYCWLDSSNQSWSFCPWRSKISKIRTIKMITITIVIPGEMHAYKVIAGKKTMSGITVSSATGGFHTKRPGYKSLNSYNYKIWLIKKEDHTINSKIPKFGVKRINS